MAWMFFDVALNVFSAPSTVLAEPSSPGAVAF
jgi:hypothetical protein